MKTVFGMPVRDTMDEVLEPDACAVLVIDVQNDAMRPEGKLARAGNDVSGMVQVLPRCSRFIAEARELGVMVVHVMTTTLRGGRSDSASWMRAKGAIVGETEFFLEGTWGAEICQEVAPNPEETVIVKHRSSAFVGTELDQVLRAAGVSTVAVIGEQTPGCVEATFRDAAYRDYYAVLVEDCVAAFDRVLHEASLLVQRRRHDVATADRVLTAWRNARAPETSLPRPGG
jgi:nicotinamidase-related amidase